MRVYQCIHKYGPHIPLFEKKYGVTDEMDFETLRKLIVQLSTKRLKQFMKSKTLTKRFQK